jgi:hypothetical protein
MSHYPELRSIQQDEKMAFLLARGIEPVSKPKSTSVVDKPTSDNKPATESIVQMHPPKVVEPTTQQKGAKVKKTPVKKSNLPTNEGSNTVPVKALETTQVGSDLVPAGRHMKSVGTIWIDHDTYAGECFAVGQCVVSALHVIPPDKRSVQWFVDYGNGLVSLSNDPETIISSQHLHLVKWIKPQGMKSIGLAMFKLLRIYHVMLLEYVIFLQNMCLKRI